MRSGSVTTAPLSRTPRVWLLLGHKAGDNTQVLALAEALGWPFESKHIVYRQYELFTNLMLGPTLAGIVKHRSSFLTPPWPDLVITAGRRNEPVARWIQQQAGGKVRLVHIGRPWTRLERFDLIISTPQYQLPVSRNVLLNAMPLHRVTQARLNEAANGWAPLLAHLPRPYFAVLVGGHSGSFVFGPPAGERLGREASAMVGAVGGSLLVTTSARSPSATIDALAAAVAHQPTHFFRWSPNAADNPYFGYLALADDIIVTGDSISMLTEACATRKPVYIFDPAEDATAAKINVENCARPHCSDRRRWQDIRLQALTHRLAMRIAPRRMKRDVRAIHQYLMNSGRAVRLGEPFPSRALSPPLEDLQSTVVRVQALLAQDVDACVKPTHPGEAGLSLRRFKEKTPD